MAGGYADVLGEIKNAYPSGSFVDPVNQEAPFRKKLKQAPYQTGPDGIIKIPLYLTGHWKGLGIIADQAAFQAPGDPSRVQGGCAPEIFQHGFTLGIKADAVSRSSQGSFNAAGIYAGRVDDTVSYLGKFMNIVYAGSNRGRIAIVESDGSNNFVASRDGGGTINCFEGAMIDVYTAFTAGAVRDSLSNRQMNPVDDNTRTVTYSGADQTAVAGDHVFFAGTYGQTPYTLDDIVDDGTIVGTIFEQSRTTYPQLKAQVHGNGGSLRNQTEQLILNVVLARQRRTGQKITAIMSNYGQALKYVEFVAAERRYPGALQGKQRYSIGFGPDSLQVVAGGVDTTLEVDYNIKPRTMYFLAWQQWGRFTAMEPDWFGEPRQLVPTTDGYKAGYIQYVACVENIFCLMPLAQAKLTDLVDPIYGDTVAGA